MIEIKSDVEFDYRPEPLFTLDGKTYECPTVFPPGVGIAYLDLLNRVGAEGAVTWLLRRALGDEAFTVLVMSEHVTDEVMASITEAVINRVRHKAPKSLAKPAASSNGSSPKATPSGAKRSSGSRSSSKRSKAT